MYHKERLTAFAEQVGFEIKIEPDIIRAVGVPCIFKGGHHGTCTIETSYDSSTGKPDSYIGQASHAVRITTDGGCDGRVYQADGTPIGNLISSDGNTWSEISIQKSTQVNSESAESARDLIYRYAKQIVGAAFAARYSESDHPTVPDPFNIPNTFEGRAAIAPIQDHVRGKRIAIIGLGGTGAYLLDLIAKTPVSEIHLLDSDCIEPHTLMRAPGGPTTEEIEQVLAGSLSKVDYYHTKYKPLRKGIHPHPIRVENSAMFAEFLSEHPIDYAFVCIDQLTDGDTSRQDFVYHALSDAGIPFIDSGVSITLENCTVTGTITTSFYEAGSHVWQNAIPNAKIAGDVPGYRNIQLPEVNAAAATFALMEWRRRTNQYAPESPSFLHKFRIEKAKILYPK